VLTRRRVNSIRHNVTSFQKHQWSGSTVY
jgi:hypothetical protein